MDTESKPEDNIELAADGRPIIQEPKKPRGVPGERLWGPYKTHSGTSVSDRYSGGPYGVGKLLFLRKVCLDCKQS